jgi:hypothetical protein
MICDGIPFVTSCWGRGVRGRSCFFAGLLVKIRNAIIDKSSPDLSLYEITNFILGSVVRRIYFPRFSQQHSIVFFLDKVVSVTRKKESCGGIICNLFDM